MSMKKSPFNGGLKTSAKIFLLILAFLLLLNVKCFFPKEGLSYFCMFKHNHHPKSTVTTKANLTAKDQGSSKIIPAVKATSKTTEKAFNMCTEKKQVSPVDNKDPIEKVRLRMEKVKKDCGEICETRPDKIKVIGKKWYNMIKKDFPCCNLFSSASFDSYTVFPKPPTKIPNFLKEDFSYHGQINITPIYRDDSKGVTHTIRWSRTFIEENRRKLRDGTLKGNYGIQYVKQLHIHLTKHMDVTGLHVLVIGSQNPWVEAIVLESGAAKITTLEYLPLKSEHPQITTMVPKDFANKFLNGTLNRFDAMVTFSSLEHSGLGRYGDGLNPYGDIITMARAWCVLKDGGKALVGFPSGKDLLTFNSDRVYGPIMNSHMFANWEQVYTEANLKRYSSECPYCYQALYVIRKNISMFTRAT